MPTSRNAQLDELLDRVRGSGGDDEVVGLVLLQHHPHRLDVVAGVAPVALGVEGAHHELVLQSELDAGRRVGHLAGHELDAAPRTLVVEQDPAARVQPVALAVVHGDVVAEHLGAAIRTAGMKWCLLGLRRLAHLAEHLRRRRLVEPDRVVLRATDHPDRLEHAQHAEPGDVGGELGLVEAQRHERDRAEVVDLVGLRQLDRGHQRREVGQIAGDRLDVRHLLEQFGDPRVALTLHHPEDVVTLTVQELGEMMTVLAGDPGDESTWHWRRCSS